MAFKTSVEHFTSLITALRKPASRPPRYTVAKRLEKIAKERWVMRYEIEDLLVDMDPRLDSYNAAQLDLLIPMFELKMQSVAFRPRKISSGTSLSQALPAAELATLLMHLEALGFNVNPEPLAALLTVQLAKATLLSEHELNVFWYDRTRHKGDALVVRIADASPRHYPENSEEWKTETGYRVVVDSMDDSPFQFRVIAPKFRTRPAPVQTTCQECGVTYYRGLPEESQSHRREHKLRMHYMKPEPCPALIAAKQHEQEPGLVTTKSPAWKHREMYCRAKAFKREFGYDFIQWQSATGDNDKDVEGHLLSTEEGVIVGAVSFRLRDLDEGKLRCLQWVWVAPSYRRGGHLSRVWAALRKRYGTFYVEPPVSDAMKAFLARHNDEWLMDFTAVEAQASEATTGIAE